MDNTEMQQSLLNAKLIIADLTMQLYEARQINFNLGQQAEEQQKKIEEMAEKLETRKKSKK